MLEPLAFILFSPVIKNKVERQHQQHSIKNAGIRTTEFLTAAAMKEKKKREMGVGGVPLLLYQCKLVSLMIILLSFLLPMTLVTKWSPGSPKDLMGLFKMFATPTKRVTPGIQSESDALCPCRKEPSK